MLRFETDTPLTTVQLLAEHLANKPLNEDESDAEIDGWDVESDAESDDSNEDGAGWINVESDDEADIYISDSDDDEETKHKAKRARSVASAAPSEALSTLSTVTNLAAEQVRRTIFSDRDCAVEGGHRS